MWTVYYAMLIGRTFLKLFLDFVAWQRSFKVLHGRSKGILLMFKRPERYNKEVLSHSFICLPLPYMEGIVLTCNIDLYCVIAICNGHW